MNSISLAPAGPPIILLHPACSGGSVTYKTLQKAFQWGGLSEIGHAKPPRPGRFLPLDPHAQMYSQNLLTEGEMAKLLADRIKDCVGRFRVRGKRVLLREHSHFYFFDDSIPRVEFAGPSWIDTVVDGASAILVSVRDPIDSWLGLTRNTQIGFPTFSEYCKMFNHFMDRVDSVVDQRRVFLFKYEEMITDFDRVMADIAKACGEASFQPVNSLSGVLSTGNSGRQSDQLSIRSRRRFPRSFALQANQCSAYRDLIDRLGYKSISDGEGCSRFVSGKDFFLKKIRAKIKRVVGN